MKVHGNSVLASAQGVSRARWETGLETVMEAWADCAVPLHMLLYPLMSHFSVAHKKSAKGKVRETWCSKWSSCCFQQSSHTSGRLLLHSAPLSWVHFWTPASSQLVVYYNAVMSSTQSRCSSICVCVFKLANLALSP